MENVSILHQFRMDNVTISAGDSTLVIFALTIQVKRFPYNNKRVYHNWVLWYILFCFYEELEILKSVGSCN